MVVGDVTTGTEVLVIGAGPGGYVAAIRAAQNGLDTTLVDRDGYGGTCLNYGCIPSKALISATDVAHDARNATEMGVHADPVIHTDEMQEWKDGVVDQLTGGVEKLCKANGVNLMQGEATFVDDSTARIAHGGEGQGSESIDFEHAIVATGSRPIQVPGFEFEHDPIWSSRDALEVEEPPEKLLVVGAGYIGMELSTVFAKLGVDVTVVEMLDGIMPGYEDDVTRPVKKRADELGIEFNFGEAASDWEGTEGGVVVTTEDEDGAEYTYDADKLLVAVGRQPVSESLDPEAAGVEVDENGFIQTDDQARTNVDNIYAVGDVAGEPMLAHKASNEGIVAAEVIAGEHAALDQQAIPAAVFTDPEIATVGMTEAEAEEAGFEPKIGQFPFRASGRALSTGESEGFVRLVAEQEAGFILGAQIVGPEASELIAECALAIEMGATLEDVASTVHTHPTLAEAVMEAAENANDEAIHTLNR